MMLNWLLDVNFCLDWLWYPSGIYMFHKALFQLLILLFLFGSFFLVFVLLRLDITLVVLHQMGVIWNRFCSQLFLQCKPFNRGDGDYVSTPTRRNPPWRGEGAYLTKRFSPSSSTSSARQSDATAFDKDKQICFILMPRTWFKVEEFRLE